MKKIIFKLLKRIVLAPFILYIYNLVFDGINLFIPINIYSILMVGIFGIPGLILITIYILVV